MSMTGRLQVGQAVVSLSFLVLGASTVIDWLRRREHNLGYLALALGTLGLTSVLGQFNTRTEYRFGTLMGDITLVLLMTSGYALLLFRDSFIPLSRWLRRLWRQAEEDQLREAVHDLVLFSPDRPTLAKRAADWGLRLVGADGIGIVDANGDILALHGLSAESARQLATHAAGGGRPRLLATSGSARENAIVLPLPLDAGIGAMVVVSGPYTPFFGTDEVSRLRGYAANITAALDRARVTERLGALEKTKSQFLNLASHELRSPLGVINGYLSMLEQGALGQLEESAVRAVEVLKAKTLELNLLVAQMLDAARLEDGRLALKRDHLDLRQLAGHAMQVVAPLAMPDHALTLETPPSPVTVFGDADRISTIISNLL